MQIDHLQSCSYAPCECQVTSAQEYCSEHCRKMAAAGHDTCTCGHAECALAPEAVGAPLAQPA